jgi:hypothetical protein
LKDGLRGIIISGWKSQILIPVPSPFSKSAKMKKGEFLMKEISAPLIHKKAPFFSFGFAKLEKGGDEDLPTLD